MFLRLCDFLQARMAPAERWAEIVRVIARFLSVEDVTLPPLVCRLCGQPRDVDVVFVYGIHWLDNDSIDDGRGGVR